MITPAAKNTPSNPVVDQLARQIRQRGLRLPALLALSVGHPLTFLGAQALLVAEPALSLFWPSGSIRRVAELFEEPAAVAELAARLAQDAAGSLDRGGDE